jgi:pilus assembly protein CpaD
MTMSRLRILATVTVLGLAGSGCAPTTSGLTPTSNPSLSSVHQPVVERTDFVFDVATSGGGVSPAELARLDAWFASIDVGYGDRVAIDEPRGYENNAVRNDIAEAAGRYGLLLSDGAPVTNGEVRPGTVRVVASRATAYVPGCPQWNSDNIAPVNNTSPNYGCATNSNLAAMIANPNDLVLGQDGTVDANANTATRAIRTYRQRQPTGQGELPATSTTTGGNN